MVISTGALADDDLRQRLCAVGSKHGAKVLIPAGAIAGLDGLGALKVSGLERVKYTSTKPPAAWHGTPAAEAWDLDTLTERKVIFSGIARDAARLYPKNANLAATVALAGLGLDDTEIELVADPDVAPCNVGRIEATAACGQLLVECRGLPAPDGVVYLELPVEKTGC